MPWELPNPTISAVAFVTITPSEHNVVIDGDIFEENQYSGKVEYRVELGS